MMLRLGVLATRRWVWGLVALLCTVNVATGVRTQLHDKLLALHSQTSGTSQTGVGSRTDDDVFDLYQLPSGEAANNRASCLELADALGTGRAGTAAANATKAVELISSPELTVFPFRDAENRISCSYGLAPRTSETTQKQTQRHEADSLLEVDETLSRRWIGVDIAKDVC